MGEDAQTAGDATLGRKGAQDQSLPENELRRRLEELEKKRSRLMAAGLLDQRKSSAFQIGDPIEEGQKKWLSVYVEDVDQKFAIFDDLFKKTEFLKKILKNKNFLSFAG